jgi:hypothetical protein
VDDGYSMDSDFHAAVDISEHEELKIEMALCHESQLQEWLPWREGKEFPGREECKEQLKERHEKTKFRYNESGKGAMEFFRFTHWAKRPTEKDLEILFEKYKISECGKAFLTAEL